MEQIITLKVDLEHPDDAKFAIDEAVKVYEADRLKWTEEEIAEAKHLAMKIMRNVKNWNGGYQQTMAELPDEGDFLR